MTSPTPPLSPYSLVQSSEKPRTPEEEAVHSLLALIRVHYLQARPPQQIKELKNLFETTVTITSTKNQEIGDGDCAAAVDLSLSSIKKICTKSTTCHTKLGGQYNASEKFDCMNEDLDRVGSKTEKDGKLCMSTSTATTTSCGSSVVKKSESGTSSCKDKKEESDERKCSSSSIIIASTAITNADISAKVLSGLYDVTIGYAPSLLAVAEEMLPEMEEDIEMESFIHPPIQYRIAFAKYIIKQLELSRNWSTPQGSNEEDVEDSVEQETLFLEKWYEGLESLSISGSRQVLSEPFYRLYEIKVARHNHKENSGTSGNRTKGIVKIFEHETSFVADGTTGLVTWKASTEFLTWLTSPWKDGGKLLLEKFGEGKEIEWVVELGCGCGFLAVALSKCIAVPLKQYIATDGSLSALEKGKLNVEINFPNTDDQEKHIRSNIRFEKVDWQNEATRESFTQIVDGMTCIHGADKGLLLGADIVFDPEIIPDLVTLINDFIEAKAGKAIVACTIRNEATMQSFKDKLVFSCLSTKICGKWEDGEILEIELSQDFN